MSTLKKLGIITVCWPATWTWHGRAWQPRNTICERISLLFPNTMIICHSLLLVTTREYLLKPCFGNVLLFLQPWRLDISSSGSIMWACWADAEPKKTSFDHQKIFRKLEMDAAVPKKLWSDENTERSMILIHYVHISITAINWIRLSITTIK